MKTTTLAATIEVMQKLMLASGDPPDAITANADFLRELGFPNAKPGLYRFIPAENTYRWEASMEDVEAGRIKL